ncbi:hypothetical protein HGRIS_003867 [Hohenbuehelia grisea]|uniref:alkaline phosphatase n=1 Tax=Hohenbuehelia grisea TaxID=104357 RepID=A0ABR3JGS7_9AGAR
MKKLSLSFVTSACFLGLASAQTFKRLGGCPTLGCVFPPDQTDFLAGAYFDIRVEVHAPVNGSEAYNNGVVNEKFDLCVQRGDGPCQDVKKFFKTKESKLETWSFQYFEDLFARDAQAPTVVNVASKVYRALRLTKPGKYSVKLKYNRNMETVAHWTVREPKRRKAKNAIFFIGDGMTQPMITAARMIAHKSINGKFQSLMQMDQMEYLGHQMTHSMDSYITDSANSASALYTGHKTHSGALNVYVDSVRSFLIWCEPYPTTNAILLVAQLIRRSEIRDNRRNLAQETRWTSRYRDDCSHHRCYTR